MTIASSSNDHVFFEFSAAQPDSSDVLSEIALNASQTFTARSRWLRLRTKSCVYAKLLLIKFLEVTLRRAQAHISLGLPRLQCRELGVPRCKLFWILMWPQIRVVHDSVRTSDWRVDCCVCNRKISKLELCS